MVSTSEKERKDFENKTENWREVDPILDKENSPEKK
jgi:hypothetical protein